jgi:hypothetical protein
LRAVLLLYEMSVGSVFAATVGNVILVVAPTSSVACCRTSEMILSEMAAHP